MCVASEVNSYIGFSSETIDVYAKNKNAMKFYCKNNFKLVNEKSNEDTNELEYEIIFSKS